jgi:MFS family permease
MFSTPATRRAITPHPRLVPASKMVLFLLCLMYLLTYIDRVNVSMASAVFDKELKLGRTQVGFIFSAFAYPYLVFQILGGYFGDYFGPRKVLTICSLIWAGATILTGLAGGFVSMIAARLLLGFGEGPTLPTATSALSSWTKPADRAFAQGLTHSFARIGNALTPPIVVALIGWVGWRGSFVVMGMASCIWMFVWFLCFRDNPAKHKRITQVELEALPSYLDGAARKRHPVPWGPLFVRMLPVTFVYFCYGWTLWLFLSWLPQYFKNQHHLDLDKAAIFSAGVFFAGVVGDTLGGMISDHVYRKTRDLKMARRNLVVVFYLCSLGCMVSLFFTEDLKLLACSLSGAFFFAEMTIGPMWSIPMDIAPRYSGSASGIMNTGSALAAILSPVVFGAVIDKTHNWSLPFLGSMGLFLAGSVVAFWMKPEEAFKIAATPGEI